MLIVKHRSFLAEKVCTRGEKESELKFRKEAILKFRIQKKMNFKEELKQ